MEKRQQKFVWAYNSQPDAWDGSPMLWKDYQDEASTIIEKAFNDKSDQVEIGDYKIEFKKMTQVHKIDENRVRQIIRLEVKNLQGMSQSDIQSVNRQQEQQFQNNREEELSQVTMNQNDEEYKFSQERDDDEMIFYPAIIEKYIPRNKLPLDYEEQKQRLLQQRSSQQRVSSSQQPQIADILPNILQNNSASVSQSNQLPTIQRVSQDIQQVNNNKIIKSPYNLYEGNQLLPPFIRKWLSSLLQRNILTQSQKDELQKLSFSDKGEMLIQQKQVQILKTLLSDAEQALKKEGQENFYEDMMKNLNTPQFLTVVITKYVKDQEFAMKVNLALREDDEGKYQAYGMISYLIFKFIDEVNKKEGPLIKKNSTLFRQINLSEPQKQLLKELILKQKGSLGEARSLQDKLAQSYIQWNAFTAAKMNNLIGFVKTNECIFEILVPSSYLCVDTFMEKHQRENESGEVLLNAGSVFELKGYYKKENTDIFQLCYIPKIINQ